MLSQKGFSPLLIVLSIALVVGVVGGGIYYQNLSKPVEIIPVPSTLPLPSAESPSLPPDSETTNWKTYEGNGMSFQYPGNGAIGDTGNVYPVYITSNANTDPRFIFSVAFQDNPNHLTAKQVVEKSTDELRKNTNAPWFKGQADKTIQTMKDYKNGLIQGVMLQSFFEGEASGFGNVIYATNDKIFFFNIHNGDGYVTASEEKIFEKILSTIKFNDKYQFKDTEMSNWKTYSNSDFGFAFQYPDNWTPLIGTNITQNGDLVGFSRTKPAPKNDPSFIVISNPIKYSGDLKAWMKERYDAQNPAYYEETINGINFQKAHVCGLGCYTYYHTIKGGYLYTIDLYMGQEDDDLLWKIVRTFKFTN